jgi:hypothetical protein
MKKPLLSILILAGLVWLGAASLVQGLDKAGQSQNKMLCQSAQKSGNAKYLIECACYYQSGDITCLND